MGKGYALFTPSFQEDMVGDEEGDAELRYGRRRRVLMSAGWERSSFKLKSRCWPRLFIYASKYYSFKSTPRRLFSELPSASPPSSRPPHSDLIAPVLLVTCKPRPVQSVHAQQHASYYRTMARSNRRFHHLPIHAGDPIPSTAFKLQPPSHCLFRWSRFTHMGVWIEPKYVQAQTIARILSRLDGNHPQH